MMRYIFYKRVCQFWNSLEGSIASHDSSKTSAARDKYKISRKPMTGSISGAMVQNRRFIEQFGLYLYLSNTLNS